MSRTFVVGDLHGGLKALMQVMQRATVSKADRFIFLGDYVDGWSESAQLVDFLLNFSSEHSCIFIKGNHDVWTEEWLRTGAAESVWLFNGGEQTRTSYASFSAEAKQQHLHFFEQMKMFHVDEQNRLFIHAGFTSMHGPEKEFYSTNYIWDRTLWEMAIIMDKRIKKDSILFPKRLKLYHEIYIGHTPTTYYDVSVPMQGCNVWNIDTGAAFTGPLTMMNIDNKEFWQSDPVQTLYPGERGRNRD